MAVHSSAGSAALILSLLALAYAEPLSLPADQDPALWADPMALHGFELGTTGSGPGAALIEGEGSWTLLVQDRAGAQHRVQIPAPTDPAAREDTLALAARLLSPSPALALPELPAPERETTPAPSPAPTAPPSPPEPALALTRAPMLWSQPTAKASALAQPLSHPTLGPPPTQSRLRMGSAFAQRPDIELSAGLSVDYSWGSPRLQVGPSLWWASPSAIPLVPGARTSELALGAGIWWLPSAGASLGVHVAGVGRAWTLESQTLTRQYLPAARLLLGWRLPLGRVEVEPALELRVDLAGTQLQLGERALGTLAPWQAGLNLAIIARQDGRGDRKSDPLPLPRAPSP